MNNLDFTISCIITFFNKKLMNSTNLNNGKYSPQIVVKGTEEHLEVNFIDGENVIFYEPILANALVVNENIDYSSFQVGTKFSIMVGSTIVGAGLVKELFNIN